MFRPYTVHKGTSINVHRYNTPYNNTKRFWFAFSYAIIILY